ncbi:amidohydrolase family protein [Jannaschia pohangensis]|uniref:Predicted metal-dependent hydrolase, TIM-barrel fold n=1 Tax=Jannaschia pohangensis TaxID=390807 RepID=A0A1I3HA17_9RHOB|nr:amidohydrolase family protein [Jannaschia pohangensis]SFI32513.1 Predicted metal-dependent hydrolase, TIM-barrel fold [Jannaschia pohangensis]
MIDSHFHIWRQADLHWLQGPSQPRIFGEYDAIKRDYPIEEYLSDAQGAGITGSVYVQANWPTERAEDEVAWVSQTAQDTGWPMGIVGYADMTVPDARPALDRLARYPLLRGIRQQFHWHENPTYRFAQDPDICRFPNVQANIARLADYGLTFDLQVFAGQMDSAAALARACPRVTLILQHAGMLEDLSDAGRADWRQAMATLAAEPNVVSKLSGFGTFIHRNDPALIAWLISETVGLFGAQRCLWGSNFPIEKLWTSYDRLLDAHRQGAGGLSAAEQADIFTNTAVRVYRLSATH